MNVFANLRNRSTTQKMVFTAILSVLAYVLNMIEIPWFTPYLRIDLSEVIVLIAVMILGLRYALAISFIKVILFAVSGSNGSEIVGLTMLLLTSVFLACFFYLFKEKLKLNIYISLIITSILFAVTFTVLNFYIFTPLYSGLSFAEMNKPGYFWSIVSVYFPFNLFKMTLISIVTVIFYKLLIVNKNQ